MLKNKYDLANTLKKVLLKIFHEQIYEVLIT